MTIVQRTLSTGALLRSSQARMALCDGATAVLGQQATFARWSSRGLSAYMEAVAANASLPGSLNFGSAESSGLIALFTF